MNALVQQKYTKYLESQNTQKCNFFKRYSQLQPLVYDPCKNQDLPTSEFCTEEQKLQRRIHNDKIKTNFQCWKGHKLIPNSGEMKEKLTEKFEALEWE